MAQRTKEHKKFSMQISKTSSSNDLKSSLLELMGLYLELVDKKKNVLTTLLQNLADQDIDRFEFNSQNLFRLNQIINSTRVKIDEHSHSLVPYKSSELKKTVIAWIEDCRIRDAKAKDLQTEVISKAKTLQSLIKKEIGSVFKNRAAIKGYAQNASK